MFVAPALPKIPYLTDRCQRFDIVGEHSLRERVAGRMAQGLGLKSGIRRLLQPSSKAHDSDPLGAISQFREGSWVRVRDEASVRKTLDERGYLRGLRFSRGLWPTCSRVYRVAKVVRRVIDDERMMRPIARTVLLHGVDCSEAGTDAGCGRHCPMWYRDEWLEPCDAPSQEMKDPQAEPPRYGRVRPLEQILSRLDPLGRREGLTLMPEMARYVGTRARIARRITRVLEYNRWVDVCANIYILEGLHCTGAVLGSEGPCDRACSLLWHADWLRIEL